MLSLRANLLVTCAGIGCQHSAIFEISGLNWYFHHRGWNASIEEVGSRFRCSACGRRGATVRAIGWGRPLPPVPEPLLNARPKRR